MIETPFDLAQRVADAVMYEGYVLYPYRASAMKNRLRWQFGVVTPADYARRASGESWYQQSECLIAPCARPRLAVKVRCLQLQRRSVEEAIGRATNEWRKCDRLTIAGRDLLSWDEAHLQEMSQVDLSVDDLRLGERVFPFDLPADCCVEMLIGNDGQPVGRVVRERWPIAALIRIAVEPCGDLLKLRVRVENTTRWPHDAAVDRNIALRQSLIGCHTLLHVEGASFVSLLDPPADVADAVASCRNEHTWPVLTGTPGSQDQVLSAPIILYDYPAIAPESAGNFFDATEIDEMLALRVMTMTDEEKSEASATDDRAREIVERTTGQAPGDLTRLHGAVRSFDRGADGLAAWETMLNPPADASPDEAVLAIGAVRIARGSRVRLQPQRRADSMDMFLAGRTATVAGVYRDLEDRAHIAVTLDDDPGADLRRAYGRFFYFSADEIVPVDAEGQSDVV